MNDDREEEPKLVTLEIKVFDFVLDRITADYAHGLKTGCAECTMQEWIGDILYTAYRDTKRREAWERASSAERLEKLEDLYSLVSCAVGNIA